MFKTKFFRITVLCTAIILVFGINGLYASGGQSSSRSSGGTVTIQVWGGVPAESGPQASVDEFNALYKDKGIQAEYTRFVNDNNGNLQLETNISVVNMSEGMERELIKRLQ